MTHNDDARDAIGKAVRSYDPLALARALWDADDLPVNGSPARFASLAIRMGLDPDPEDVDLFWSMIDGGEGEAA